MDNLWIIMMIAMEYLRYNDLVGDCCSTPLKKIRVKVNWDDDIPNGKTKNVPNHQPDHFFLKKQRGKDIWKG